MILAALFLAAVTALPDGPFVNHVHRGGGARTRPDNTLETFVWAWRQGVGVECDCRLTKDGVPVLVHDETLRRTGRQAPEGVLTNKIADLTYEQIRNVDVGSYLDPRYAAHRVPTLARVFAELKTDPRRTLFVDDKGIGPERLAAEATAAGVLGQVWYTTCSPEQIVRWYRLTDRVGKSRLWWGPGTREHTPEALGRAEQRYEELMRRVRAQNYEGVTLVCFDVHYNPAFEDPFVPSSAYLGKLAGEFARANVRFTCIPYEGGDDPNAYRRLRELGVEGFGTDDPEALFDHLYGHVQGCCSAAGVTYVTRKTQLLKFDAAGQAVAVTNVVDHTGDLCLWKNRLYTAVAVREGEHKGKGLIQVFDTNLVLQAEQEFPRGLDGITCLDGKLYVGEAKPRGHAAHRGNPIVCVDAATLKTLFRRELDHGFATYHGVQNAATEGGRLYFRFYPAEEKEIDTVVCSADLCILSLGRAPGAELRPEAFVPDSRLMDFVTEPFAYAGLHLQGISCDESGIYYGFANGVTKTDWTGKVLGAGVSSYGSDGHIGDVCVHSGKVYATSWTQPKGKSYLERMGLIQVFDATTMKPLPDENRALPYPTDGIEFYEGAFWIGKPYRGPSPHTNMTIAVWNEDFSKELATPVHVTDGTKILYTMQTLAEMDGLLWHGCYVDEPWYRGRGEPIPGNKTYLTDRDGKIVCASDVWSATGLATVPTSLARGRKLVITARNEGNRVRVRFFEYRDNRLEPALRAVTGLDERGFVRDWLVSGPYPNYQNADGSTKGYGTDFLLDAGGETFAFPRAGERRTVDFVADKAKLIAGQGSVNEWGRTETFAADTTWRTVHFDSPVPELDAFFPPVKDYFVSYALAYFTAEREETVKIAVGSDDGHAVWVNDVRLGGKASSQAAAPGTFNYWVKLRKGRNKILFKLVEVSGGSGFCVQILEKEGRPVKGIRIDNDLTAGEIAAFRRALHPPRPAQVVKKENAALAARIAEMKEHLLPALEEKVTVRAAQKREAKAALARAFETAEQNFAAERARNLAGAPRSCDKPLGGAECRRRLCVNGLWEGSRDDGQTWMATRLPRLLCCHYAHNWFTAPSARKDPFASVPTKDGSIRYRTTFGWDGSGAVDFVAETIVGTAKVRCNGVPSGEYDGLVGIVRFPLKGLKRGVNELEVEIGLSKWPKHEREGILGDLYLDYLPEARVEGVHVKTSWEKATVSVRTELRNLGAAAAEFEVRQYVTEAGRVRLELPPAKATLGPGETKFVETASGWADPKVWGIGGQYGDPDLYTLVTDVWSGGRQIDRQRETFGFREFRVFHTDFFLNGKRIVLQGDTGALMFEMQRNREIAWNILRNDGINIIRVHDGGNWSVPTASESDRMGMLVYAQHFPVMKESLHTWNLANYERWWKTFRNHPSVVIWCTDNETLTQAWDTAARAEENIANEKFVVRYEKYVKGLDPACVMTRDGDLGTQNHKQRWYEDPPCDTANYHYPDFNVKEQVVNWRKTYEWRPVIFGETLYGSFCGWDKWIGPIPSQVRMKAEKVRRIVGVYRDEEIPAAVFMGLAMDGYAVADETGKGNPFGITESQRLAYEKAKTLPPGFTADEYPWGMISWPSPSGRGLRHEGLRRHYWYYTCELFNAYDPKWPTHVRNAVADAYRETLLPQPKLRVGADAEALVVGAKPGESVWATCPDGSVLGMRADADGTAWFREIDPGRYAFDFAGKRLEADLKPRGDAVLTAGFDYLDVVR